LEILRRHPCIVSGESFGFSVSNMDCSNSWNEIFRPTLHSSGPLVYFFGQDRDAGREGLKLSGFEPPGHCFLRQVNRMLKRLEPTFLEPPALAPPLAHMRYQ